MRFVIQRVYQAEVTVEGKSVGKIGKGLMILVGLTDGDTEEYIDHVTDKFLNLRLWDGSDGTRWKECVKSLGLEILLVSQFTLYGHMKGNKPDFHFAMDNDPAKILFDKIVDRIKKKYDPNKIQTGMFGAYMKVSLVNDGPITIEWEYPGDKLENIKNNNVKKEKREDFGKDLGGKKRGEKKEGKKDKEKKKDNKEQNKQKEDEKKEDKKEEQKEDKKDEDKKNENKKEEEKKEEGKNEDKKDADNFIRKVD